VVKRELQIRRSSPSRSPTSRTCSAWCPAAVRIRAGYGGSLASTEVPAPRAYEAGVARSRCEGCAREQLVPLW